MHILRNVIAVASCASFLVAPVLAQEPTPSPSPAVSALTATPIPLADVIASADATTERLAATDTELAGNATSANIDSALKEITRDIDERLHETRRTLTPGAPLETMRDLETRWQAVFNQLGVWSRDLTSRATYLDREIAQLPELRATWRATIEQARSSAAPAEITQRIDSVLKAIAQTDALLQKRRTAILSLQSRAAEQTQRASDALRSVNAAQSAAVDRLWVQDSAPIWAPHVRAEAKSDLVTQSQVSFGAQSAQLRSYIAREWARLVYFGLILFAFAFVLIGIKRRTARWTDEDPALARANRVLQLPWATASILAFLLARPLFPEAPRLFWVALASAALVPIVILLRRLIDRHLFPIVNALVVFYVIAQLRTLTAALPVLSRVILLLEMVGGAVFLAWFIRSTRRSGDRSTSRKATRAAARVGTVLFIAVFVTNSLGFVALANYLGTGALATAYIAILLYAAAGIVEGLSYFALQIQPLAALGVVQRHRPLLRRRIGWLIYFVAFVAWVLFSLDAFSLRRALIARVSAFFNAEAHVGSLHLSLGALVAFGLTLWIAVLLSRFIRFVLEEDIYGRLKLAPGSSYAVSTIFHYVILLAGFFAALAAVGIDMTKFAILAGAFGVGIGFGLQNIFNNFFSGLILLFERPVRVGDVIALGGVSGVVQRIGIRASVIRLADGSELIVPNGQLISEKVTNRTVPSRQARIDLRVGVSYGSDPQSVIDILTAAAVSHPLAASKPAPEAFMKEFGSDALLFDLTLWTDEPLRAPRVQSDVAVAVNRALRDAGIEIPFPQRNLHLQSIGNDVANALQSRGEQAHRGSGVSPAPDGA